MNQYFNPQPKTGKAIKDAKYIECVKQLPCVICEAYGEPYGQAPSDAHHPICGRYSGAKVSDYMAIPLCKSHHQSGEHGKVAIHLGKATWVKLYGNDIDYIEVTQDRVEREFGYTPKGII